MKKKSIASKVIIAVTMLFFYLPIVYIIVFSFNDSRSLTTFGGFSLEWYEKMFSNSAMMEAVFYTVVIAVIATAVSTVLGTITAIGLSRCRKIVQSLVEQVNSLPVMNPEIVTAIGLLMFFSAIAIRKGFMTMLLAHIMFCTPYVMLSVSPKLRSLDPNLIDAAMDLGATPFQALYKVIVPQVKPGIISGALIAFTMSFDDFIISYFVTGNGIQNISILVYTMSKRVNPSINALSTLVILLITVALVLGNLIPVLRERAQRKRLASADAASAPARRAPRRLYAAAAAALVVAIAGGAVLSGTASARKTAEAVEKYGSATLKFYNCGEYVGENLISDFEQKFGVNVIEEFYDSNEMMYTKVQAGDSYDILVPSDYMIQRLMRNGMLQELDHTLLPNLDNLADAVKGFDYDPDNTYSVPYFWGSVGLVYNHNNVPSELIEEQGYSILKNTDYRGRIYFYDSERDAFMIAFKALGCSMNTEDEGEILEAYDWLVEMSRTMEPAYVTDEVIDGMIGGVKDIAVVYSGDAAVILDENEDMSFWMPSEGTNIWCDAMVIPANAENPLLAHEFINFVLTYEASYDNTETVGYASPNAEVLEEMTVPGGLYAENEAYYPRVGYEKDEVFVDNLILTQKLGELWIKVKAQ